MKKFIRIVADYNDADYKETFEEISDEVLALILPVVEAVKAFKPYTTKTADGEMDWRHHHNWPSGDRCRDDLGEKNPEELYLKSGLVTEDQFYTFEELVPCHEYGVHTIKSVEVIHVAKTEQLYQHNYV